MRRTLAVVLTVALSSIGGSPTTKPDKPPAIRVRVAVQERETESPVNLHVVVENVSNEPLAIFEDWNSWGYRALTLDFTLPDGKHAFASVRPRNFSRNFPSSSMLQPGDFVVRDVRFDDKTWTGLPTAGMTPVTVKASFEQDPTGLQNDKFFLEHAPELVPARLWHGKAESSPVPVTMPEQFR